MSLDQKTITPEDKKRLEAYEQAGLRVLQELDDLKGGLKETTMTLAEELQIKPAKLMKVLRLIYKSKIEEEKESTATVEELLHILGHI